MELCADRRGQLGVDQLLHPALQQPAEQILAVAVAELRDKVVEAGIIMVGHRVFLFLSEYLVVLTKSHAMAHLTGGPSPLLPPPHGTPTSGQADFTDGGMPPTSPGVVDVEVL